MQTATITCTGVSKIPMQFSKFLHITLNSKPCAANA
jgi:hypothetical protein